MSIASLLDVFSDDLLKLNNNLKSIGFTHKESVRYRQEAMEGDATAVYALRFLRFCLAFVGPYLELSRMIVVGVLSSSRHCPPLP